MIIKNNPISFNLVLRTKSKINDIDFIENEISKNREVSVNMRDEIRKYFDDNFSWQDLVLRYVDNIKNIVNRG